MWFIKPWIVWAKQFGLFTTSVRQSQRICANTLVWLIIWSPPEWQISGRWSHKCLWFTASDWRLCAVSSVRCNYPSVSFDITGGFWWNYHSLMETFESVSDVINYCLMLRTSVPVCCFDYCAASKVLMFDSKREGVSAQITPVDHAMEHSNPVFCWLFCDVWSRPT